MHYSTENRSVVKRDFPDLSFADINRKLGEGWASISEAEKAVRIKKKKE